MSLMNKGIAQDIAHRQLQEKYTKGYRAVKAYRKYSKQGYKATSTKLAGMKVLMLGLACPNVPTNLIDEAFLNGYLPYQLCLICLTNL